MLKLSLTFFLCILINVQTQTQPENWWYSMGDDWEVSEKFAEESPIYATQQQMGAGMDYYGFATHVGKINRGQLFNPELNNPADNAFGYQGDFNLKDFTSGAFSRKPQGQKIRANSAHVNEGLASYEGEVLTLPAGQYLQEDGSILLQMSTGRADPCNPNPCTHVRMPTCTPVNAFTAKCTRKDDYKLTLTWADPNSWDSDDNNIHLQLVPDYHDGTQCEDETDYLEYTDEYCGAFLSADDYAYDPNLGEESATLTTLADGTNYKSYTYAVIAYMTDDPYNLSEGDPTLTLEYNGVVKQTLAIPQYKLWGSNLNYMDLNTGVKRAYYFFGCFRPQLGYIDTRGAGFYNDDTIVIVGLDIFSHGLCKATLGWSSGYGFNPYDQSGSGDERGSGTP